MRHKNLPVILQNHLLEMDAKKAAAPTWETVRYMISCIQYGGRITDDFDQLLMDTFAQKYFDAPVLLVRLCEAAEWRQGCWGLLGLAVVVRCSCIGFCSPVSCPPQVPGSRCQSIGLSATCGGHDTGPN